MKPTFKAIILLLFSTLYFNCYSQSADRRSIIGKWGYKGLEINFVNDSIGTIKSTDGTSFNKFYYKIDFTKSPYWFDYRFAWNRKKENNLMPFKACLMQLVDNNTLLIQMSKDDKRPLAFDSAKALVNIRLGNADTSILKRWTNVDLQGKWHQIIKGKKTGFTLSFLNDNTLYYQDEDFLGFSLNYVMDFTASPPRIKMIKADKSSQSCVMRFTSDSTFILNKISGRRVTHSQQRYVKLNASK